MLVRELMTRTVQSIGPNATLVEAARRMRDHNIGCLPVGYNNDFIGIVTGRDFSTRATATAMDPTSTTVAQIMTVGINYCHDDDSIENALHKMGRTRKHHLPVRDRSEQLVGIITLSDFALKVPHELYPDVARLAFQSPALNQEYSGELPK
jgi:CBS domain-containing protein